MTPVVGHRCAVVVDGRVACNPNWTTGWALVAVGQNTSDGGDDGKHGSSS